MALKYLRWFHKLISFGLYIQLNQSDKSETHYLDCIDRRYFLYKREISPDRHSDVLGIHVANKCQGRDKPHIL